MDSLDDFQTAMANPFSLEAIDSAVHFVVKSKEHLTDTMVNLLSECIPHEETEGYNLDDLVTSQLTSAISLKDSYFNSNGKLKEGVSGRDAKDALASCQQIITVLMKQQEQLDRNSRLMKMENILIGSLDTISEEHKAKFLDEVARQLEEA